MRRAILVVVNVASSSARDVTSSLAERAWREVHSASSVAPPPMDFEVVYEQSLVDGARVISRAINQLRCASHPGL